jgi:hypothetical protein
MPNEYWQYIEKMICNIPVDDDKTSTSSKFPKNLFSREIEMLWLSSIPKTSSEAALAEGNMFIR